MGFKISYDWQFYGEHYTNTYPEPTDEDYNIFKICGKNEQGKTTTLKIIALAFGNGSEDTGNIGESLLNEISDLVGDDTELNFNFTITSPAHNLSLKCDYKNKKPIFKFNGEFVGETQIKDKFIVLFDKPEPIEEKLKNSLKVVRSRFKYYTDVIKDYRSKLEEWHKSIMNYNEAENEKQKIVDKIKEFQEQLKNLEKFRDKIKNELPNTRKIYVDYQYFQALNKFNKADEEIKRIEREIKKNKNKQTTVPKDARQLQESVQELEKMINSSIEIFNRENGKDNQEEIAKLLKYVDELSDIENIDLKTLNKIYTFYLDQKQNAEISEKNNVSDRDRMELELIDKLLKVINEYANIDPVIPGAEKKISDLIEPLRKREKELSSLISKEDSITAIIKNSDEIIKQIGKVTSDLGEFQKIRKKMNNKEESSIPIDVERLEKQKKELESERDKYHKEYIILKDEYNSIPESERNSFINHPNIVKEYEKIDSDLKEYDGKIDDIRRKIEVKEEYLQSQKELKKPDTKMSPEEISNEMKISGELLQKLEKYHSLLNNIDLKKMQITKNTSNDESNFYNKIGEYLASIVETIYHNKTPNKIINIDFANGEYVLADESKRIKFNRIGTGTKALNSLLAKIKQDFQGKKKIILIDEIGDMDNENQNNLLDEIKEQIKNGDAILALMTERDDSSDKVRAIPVPFG